MKTLSGALKSDLIDAAQRFLETMVVVDDHIRLSASVPPPSSGEGEKVLVSPGFQPRELVRAATDTESNEAEPLLLEDQPKDLSLPNPVSALDGETGPDRKDQPEELTPSVSAADKAVPMGDTFLAPLGDSIDMQALIRGAADQSLICSLIDPLAFGNDKAATALIKVLGKADICVFDWRIQGFEDGALTLDVLAALVEPVAPKRHRIFCIYSHYDDAEAAFKLIQERLGSQFKREGAKYVLKHQSILVVWLAKQRHDSQGSPERVGEEDLAKRLVETFALLRPGLIPLFAMKSLANVRRHTLSLIGRYSSEGDHGFVSDMALQDDPSVSDGQLAEALGDDLAILARSVFDEEWLSPAALEEWLRATDVKINEAELGIEDAPGWDEKLGMFAGIVRSSEKSIYRDVVAKILTSSSQNSLKAFAELLCCEFELDAKTAHLRPGTVVKNGDDVLVCVQPLCDSYIRGNTGSRPFPFVPLIQKRCEPHIAFKDGSKTNKVLFAQPKLYTLSYHTLTRTDGARVAAVNKVYLTEDGKQLSHLAVLRDSHSQRILALLGFDAGRVGLSESEFFRQKARERAPLTPVVNE